MRVHDSHRMGPSRARLVRAILGTAASVAIVGCGGSNSNTGNNGGAGATGGNGSITGTGGVATVGGNGGGLGGITATGGVAAKGGNGGVTGLGGITGSGGAATIGGFTGSGGITSTGGLTGGGGSSTSIATGGSQAQPGDSVLMHHKNLNRDGLYIQPSLTKAAVATLKADTAFSATVIKGAVYAQPLFVDGGGSGKDLLIIATELNNVHALDAVTGAEIWTKNLGTPVPLSSMPCGNIDPFGITGTPVIDFASRTIFVDAMTTPDSGATKKHLIFALSVDTGATKSGWPVDVGAVAKNGTTTFNNPPQGQRGALAIVNGTLYVPFGGLYGDCGAFHGWVISLPISDPTQVQSWATTLMAGGIWAPGGISSDSSYIYVSTGNTQGATSSTAWGGGDAVIRLGLGAAFANTPTYFAPRNWVALDNGDLDLGTAPIVFDLAGSTPGQLAIAFGKDGGAYLLDRMNLGGVGNAIGGTGTGQSGSAATLHVTSNEIITAPALYKTPTATYVSFRGNGAGCTSGTGDLTTLKIVPGSPPSLAHSWCATGGAGSPIVTTSDGTNDAIVWSLGADGDNQLHAFDGDTGTPIAFAGSTVKIPNMRRFNTPIAAKGRIIIGADNSVMAFKL